jgi:hypothetical protein
VIASAGALANEPDLEWQKREPEGVAFQNGTGAPKELSNTNDEVRSFVDLLHQPSVLLAQLGQLGPFRCRHPGPFTTIDARLANPVPQRALTDPQTRSHINDRAPIIEHHRHCVGLELLGERPTPTRWLFLHY